MTQAQIRQRMIAEVKDESEKICDPEDYDNAIESALKEFSRQVPDVSVEDVVGSGTNDQDLPAGWVNEFSYIKQIEFPIGNIPATYLDPDNYLIYSEPSGDKIRLLDNKPAVTESIRVSYTTLRISTTVPEGDIEAFILLASAFCLQKLANAWLQMNDSLIAADSVDRENKSRDATARSRALRELYRTHLGLKDNDTTKAAAATADFDYGYPGGGSRLTHGRSGRESR